MIGGIYLFNLSYHAINKYAIRGGVKPYKAAMQLNCDLCRARYVDSKEAKEVFPILHEKVGDCYLVWYNERIKELMCAIVRKDCTVVTVITPKMYGWVKRGRKIRFDFLERQKLHEEGVI